MLRPDLPADHFCEWRDEAERLSGRLDEVERQLVELRRKVFGRRSEKTKVPPVDRELRKERPVDRAAVTKKRTANATRKKELVTEEVEHRVPDAQRICPACDAGAAGMKAVGAGRESVEIEHVAAYFRRRVHRRETLACRCGQYIVTAPAPPRVTDKTVYGPGFVAHLITSKCSTSTPIYRLEKYYAQTGIPLARSTMNDLVHRAAGVLSPLAKRILARVAAADVVHADETPHRLQTTLKRPYLWTFTDGRLIAYQCSPTRSGDTPAHVLGSSKGTLVVDAHTGYNVVTKPGGRRRAGCLAHARRKFYEALATAPEAHVALDAIRAVYRVEHDALEAGVQRTDEHLAMRQTRSRPILEELHGWLKEQRGQHPPKGPMGRAIGYAMRQWEALTVFLEDPKVPPDNNTSERALKVIALGRKNFLFFGHEHAGDNFAVLYTLVASCEAVGVSPIEYLTDVLLRVQTHPADQIDDLLPDRWTRPTAQMPAAA